METLICWIIICGVIYKIIDLIETRLKWIHEELDKMSIDDIDSFLKNSMFVVVFKFWVWDIKKFI